MARPMKDGVDYWPLDVDFLTCDEIRMIRTQFGAKGVLIAVALINECYKSAGYFKKWDDDCCLLMADAVSCGITPELISQVMQECVRRSLFDNKVLNVHSVLTSAGIQRRYLRMLNNRNEIEIIKEYWLLDVNSRKDVPASVVDKLTFKHVKSDSKGDKSNSNPVKSPDNPQSKVKESKGKKSKEDMGGRTARKPTLFVPPSLDDIRAYCRERNNGVDAQRFYDYYSTADWVDAHGNPVRNWKQKLIANWENKNHNPQAAAKGGANSGTIAAESPLPGVTRV